MRSFQQELPQYVQHTWTNCRSHEHLPENCGEPEQTTAMLKNDKSLIKRDVRGCRKIKATPVDRVTIEARPYVMDDPDLGIIDKLGSSLPSLKRKCEFPIDLSTFASQLGLESDLPEKVAPKHKVRTSKDINLSRLAAPSMMIARDATEPMKTSHIVGHRFRATHFGMILKHISTAGSINVRIPANMFDHSLDPLGRQFDIIVQQRDILA
jgi:hypothetical protein